MLELARITTDPEPCPYLHDRLARTELRLIGAVSRAEYAARLGEGLRRFGRVLFRAACDGCRECVPIRVPVARFLPSRSQKRVLRRNRGVEVEAGPPQVDAERIDLYHAFHRERSERVGWKRQEIEAEEYRRTFVENAVPTLELRYRIEGRLAAVAYVDESPGALNSIYCFHHPDFHRRSLGTFDILTEIQLAARLGKEHLYLGYFIAGCRSMAYKARFRPAEVLAANAWREVEPA